MDRNNKISNKNEQGNTNTQINKIYNIILQKYNSNMRDHHENMLI